MRALTYQSENKKLVLKEVATPTFNGKGTLIQILASSICGTDLRTYRYGSGKIDDGIVIGHEFVGKILEISVDLAMKDFKVGDYIGVAPAIGCGECKSCKKGYTNMCDNLQTIGFQYNGSFTEYMEIPSQAFEMGNVYKLPETDDYSIFTISEPLACAINAQAFLEILPRDNVLIYGSGILACMHAELAIHSGADKVFIIGRRKERIEELQAALNGYSNKIVYINSKEAEVREEVLNLTNGFGVDVAIIACSSGSAQADSLELLGKRGRLSLFGGLPNESNGFLDSNIIHYKEVGVFGAHASTPEQNKQAMELIYNNQININNYTSNRYSLEDIEKAFKDVDQGNVLKATIVNSVR